MEASISVKHAPLELLHQTLPRLLSNLSIARAQIAIDQIRATIDTHAVNRITFLGASANFASIAASGRSQIPPVADIPDGGTIESRQKAALLTLDDSIVNVEVSGLFGYEGLNCVRIEEAGPGDIVALSGIDRISIGETLSYQGQP